MRTVIAASVVLVLAVGATLFRYGSLDPCDWLEADMLAKSNLPRLVIEARIQARFLLDGILEPDFGDCLHGWWSFRLEELPEE